MKAKQIYSLVLVYPFLFAAIGCAAVGCEEKSRRVESGTGDMIISVGEIDVQDAQEATSKALQSMLETGVFKQAPKQPAILRIGTVKNNTSSSFPMSIIVKGMQEQLVNSGQVLVNSSSGANAEAKVAQQERSRESFESGQPSVIKDDFLLTVSINQVKRTAGDTKQTTYFFNFDLARLSGDNLGLTVWTKQEPISKTGKKAAIGF